MEVVVIYKKNKYVYICVLLYTYSVLSVFYYGFALTLNRLINIIANVCCFSVVNIVDSLDTTLSLPVSLSISISFALSFYYTLLQFLMSFSFHTLWSLRCFCCYWWLCCCCNYYVDNYYGYFCHFVCILLTSCNFFPIICLFITFRLNH